MHSRAIKPFNIQNVVYFYSDSTFSQIGFLRSLRLHTFEPFTDSRILAKEWALNIG